MPLITLDPTGVRPVDTHSIAPRLTSLDGKRVGLLHNVKVNARELVSEIGGLLEQRYGATVLPLMLTAGTSGMLATPEQLKELAGQADFVITAVGD